MAYRRKILRGVTAAVLGWTLSAAIPCEAAETSAVDPALAKSGWMELAIPGKTPTRYSRTADGALEARSEASVSILYRMLGPKEQNCRVMAWRWRVDQAVPPTDPARAGTDDRDLAVHVWFSDGEEQGLWKALSGAISSVLGIPRMGKSITYVFGGSGERDRRLVNPHHDPDGIIVLLRPSGTATGQWFSERVDFAADYRRAFGKAAPKPMYVAVSADSDDTGTRSTARIADIRFSRE